MRHRFFFSLIKFNYLYFQKAAIGGGLIRVNGKPVKPDRIFRSQDFLQSRVHRHEPPVSGEPLEIISEDEDFVVINKPSSIPVSILGNRLLHLNPGGGGFSH